MKKILAMILALTVVAGFGACGNEEKSENVEPTQEVTAPAETEAKEDVAKDENAVAEEKSEEKAPEADKKEEQKDEKKAEEKKAPEAEKKDAPAKSKTLTMGKNDGSVYENDYFGLAFRLPEGWNFFSDNQLSEANGVPAGISGDELLKAAERPTGVYVMGASNNEKNSVNLLVSKLPAEAQGVDENAFLSATLAKTKDAFAQQGVENLNVESAAIDIGGRQIPAGRITYKVQGKSVDQALFCLKKDDCMAVAAIICVDSNDLESILASFFVME